MMAIKHSASIFLIKQLLIDAYQHRNLFAVVGSRGVAVHQSIYTKGSRRKLNGKKTIANDDVNHGAMARNILN